jgi:hypothetical protein
MSEANRGVAGVDPPQGAGLTALDDAPARLDRARVPADLFGADEAEAARRHRRPARLVHPDATGGRTRDACTLPAQSRRPSDAWRLLAELDELLERLYGRRRFRPFHLPAQN